MASSSSSPSTVSPKARRLVEFIGVFDLAREMGGASSAAERRVRLCMLAIKSAMVAKLAREDNVPARVDDHLFIGSVGSAVSRDALRAAGITHIVTAADGLMPQFDDELEYLCLPLRDAPDERIADFFDASSEFIHQAIQQGGSVLVHCFAGKSRSSTILLAYLLARRGASLLAALTHLRSVRPQAAPNSGFLAQLLQLERSLHDGATSTDLVSLLALVGPAGISPEDEAQREALAETTAGSDAGADPGVKVGVPGGSGGGSGGASDGVATVAGSADSLPVDDDDNK